MHPWDFSVSFGISKSDVTHGIFRKLWILSPVWFKTKTKELSSIAPFWFLVFAARNRPGAGLEQARAPHSNRAEIAAESVKISYGISYAKHMISYAYDIIYDIIHISHHTWHHVHMTSYMTSSYISYEMWVWHHMHTSYTISYTRNMISHAYEIIYDIIYIWYHLWLQIIFHMKCECDIKYIWYIIWYHSDIIANISYTISYVYAARGAGPQQFTSTFDFLLVCNWLKRISKHSQISPRNEKICKWNVEIPSRDRGQFELKRKMYILRSHIAIPCL